MVYAECKIFIREEMSKEETSLGTPSYAKIASLRPEAQGLKLLVTVVDKNLVLDRQPSRVATNATNKIAECTVGDETGVIVLVAKNEQADLVQVGKTFDITNGRIDMFKGSMRLAVGQNGSIEESNGQQAKPKVEHNLSLIEFESVLLPAQNGLAH